MTDRTADLSQDTAGWPPERSVFPVAGIRLEIVPGDHPLEVAERQAIRENWQGEIAANPALYDGRLVLQRHLAVGEKEIRGQGHLVAFSTFLWWRRQPARPGGLHLFAYPVLVSADGALVAIRMGPHTANPGQVYFAAGSLEPADIVDGRCDLDANMRREVLEETGLDLGDAASVSGYYATHVNRVVTVFRLYRFAETAQALAGRIARHAAEAEEQEIDGPVVIRSADPAADRYNVSMLPILTWFFEAEG